MKTASTLLRLMISANFTGKKAEPLPVFPADAAERRLLRAIFKINKLILLPLLTLLPECVTVSYADFKERGGSRG